MIKKLFGFFVFVCLGFSFCNGREYIPCEYAHYNLSGGATSGNCIKASPNEVVDLTNLKFTINGSNISVYDYEKSENYSGIYGRNRLYGNVFTRVIYKDGEFITYQYDKATYPNNPSKQRIVYMTGAKVCISDDYNFCMRSNTSVNTIYTIQDISDYYGLTYDYVILPYTQSSNYSLAYGNCFHFPSNDKYLCFPTFQAPNTSASYGRLTGTVTEFENLISDSFPFGGHGTNQIYYNQYQCPTVKQLIDNYDANGFYSGMCYTSDRIFNGSTFETIEPQSILDLYVSSEGFVNDLYKFGQYCESSVYNQSVCQEAFSGQFYRFNLLSKLPTDLTYLGGRKQTYIYCSLYTLDPNSTTCTLGTGTLGSLGTEFTNSDVVHSLANGEYAVVLPNTSGTVYDGDYVWSGDIISNVQNMFTRFTSLFKKQTGNSNGFLPTWIIYPFLILVLFKLFKK